ncbi:transposase, MuDR, MULE transposase domain protein [Tanacetum coccineum]
MTSNSVELVNALTKDVRKLLITMLMDWFRDLLQKWYYERRDKHEDAPDDELTEWATAKVNARMLKSANWTVKGVDKNKVYEIRDNKKIHVVHLEKGECTCRKWQILGLPCGHVCAMASFAGLSSVTRLAKLLFLNKSLKGTYEGIIYPLQDVSSWHTPHDLQVVLPPILCKNQPGRPKNKDRIPSQGEGWINNKCGRCGAKGYNRTACNVPLPKHQTNLSKRVKSTHDPSSNKDSQVHKETSTSSYNLNNQSHHERNHDFNLHMMYEPQVETNNMEAMCHSGLLHTTS